MGLGLHGGGAGAARFFAKAGWRVTVTDLKSRRELAQSLKELRGFSSIRYILGRHRKKDFFDTNLIIKGAGISWKHPLLVLAQKRGVPIESDVGIFFELCPAPIIGVTGSKGKSTVATLIALLLRKKYRSVFLAGNIRKSVLDVLPRVTKKSLVVLELSSWQLEDLARHKKSPHIAIITNILREHLNKYENFAAYTRAKSLIFRFQKKNDYLFIPKQDLLLRRIIKKTSSCVRFFQNPFFHILNPRLLGSHNETNVAAVLAVAKLYGIPRAKQHSAINDFKGLEGRLEFVTKKRGVKYYNDTTATMPDAAIAALRTVMPRTHGNIILIAGGTDKKLDFKNFAKEIVKNAQTVVWLPGDATRNLKSQISRLRRPVCRASGTGRDFGGQANLPKQIAQQFDGASKSAERLAQYDARTMKDAVAKATKAAKAGDTVLLSPGAASFGLFQNEFERGDEFVRWVKKSSE